MKTIAENVKSNLAATDGGSTIASKPAPGAGANLRPEEAIDAVVERSLSALKLLTLDQGVAMDTYIHSYNQRIQDELQRRKTVSQEIGDAVEETHAAAEDLAESADQISQIADDQTASTEEVASMVDELVDQADTIAGEVDDIAAANEEQTANVRQIRASVQRLNQQD